MEDLIGDFFNQIDDLLEFPNEDETIFASIDQFQHHHNHPHQQQQILPFSTEIDDTIFLPHHSSSNNNNNQQHQLDELSKDFDIIPLEWMSQFLEDSDTIPVAGGPKQDPPRSSSPVSVLKPTEIINPNSNFQSFSSTSMSTSSASSSSSSSSHDHDRCNNSDDNKQNNVIQIASVVPARTRSKRPRSATSAVVASRPRITITFPVKPAVSSAVEKNIDTTNNDIITPAALPADSRDGESVGDSSSNAFAALPPPAKKKKKANKKKMTVCGGEDSCSDVEQENANVRKCLHCEITKTPQWRAGPMGPKTLCNACGVRYKSGRLFPEYRPAASPTFVPSVHSNSHKKVVEMRNNAADNRSNCELLDYIRMQRVN